MPTCAPAALITSEDAALFREQGFAKLRRLLKPREVGILQVALQEALGSFDQSPNGYDVTATADWFWNEEPGQPVRENSVQHDLEALSQLVRNSGSRRLIDLPAKGPRGHFLLDTGVWRRVPALAEFVLTSALPQIARALLDCDAIRFYDDQLFVKQPGAVDRTAFHQDFPYFHLDRPDGCVFWIPLTPVREGGGRMCYVPGSHRWGKAFKPNIFVATVPFPDSQGADMPPIEDRPEEFDVAYLDAEPGDVLVHHFLTVHGSEGNRQRQTRAAFSLRYCDATVRFRRRPGAPCQPLHRMDMQDGSPLDETIHPIVHASASIKMRSNRLLDQ